MRLGASLTTIAAGVAVSGSASAQGATELIHVEYSAGPDCPDRNAFEGRIFAQTSRARLVDAGQSRTFDVVMRGGATASGEVTVRRGDSIEGVRKVTGESCAEVADELALVVTLAVDPGAISRPPRAASATDTAGVVGTAAPSTRAPGEQPPVATSVAPSRPAPPSATDSGDGRPVAPAPRTLFLGIDGSAAGGVAPSSMLSVSPLVGWRAQSHAWLTPSLRASFAHAVSGTIAGAGGEASFTWTVGRVDACVLSWPPGPAHLLACARVEAGVLGAAGSDIPGALSKDRGWAATGPLLRGEWELLGPLFVQADVAPMFRLTTDRFFFRPDATIYSVPTLGLEGDAGVGVHFL